MPTLRKTPTTEKATNTGISLLLLGAPAASLEGSEEVSRDSGAEASGVSMNTMTTREVSIKTESSVQASGPINLDLCSFGTSLSSLEMLFMNWFLQRLAACRTRALKVKRCVPKLREKIAASC